MLETRPEDAVWFKQKGISFVRARQDFLRRATIWDGKAMARRMFDEYRNRWMARADSVQARIDLAQALEHCRRQSRYLGN